MNKIDVMRSIGIILIFWNAGITFAALVRFTARFYRSSGVFQKRLWMARIILRVAFLGLLYFALSASLQHWDEPVMLRGYVLAIVLLITPWAHAELVRDVLREGVIVRRSDDG